MVSINYNSYQLAEVLLQSVKAALAGVDQVAVDFVLSDNSTKTEGDNFINQVTDTDNFKFYYLKNNNVGYFPAFYRGLSELAAIRQKLDQYDYVIVSNVDLEVDIDFFRALCDAQLAEDVGVVAPAILSRLNLCDNNPQKMTRPPKWKLKLLSILFRSPFLFHLYSMAYNMKMKTMQQAAAAVRSDTEQYAYSAHGSFIIFTKNYVKSGASLNYPRFLFGEELFVAEEAANHGLKVLHFTKARVLDNEHASTSAESRRFICKEQVKSYDYLLKKYY